ncbi:ferredoxin [bacterium]|nr:MAG: ferredoxin [bacterium]
MHKVSVDTSTCVGCGLCEQNCPEVFKVEGDGIAHVKAQVCSLHNLQEVAEQCPVNAIKAG